MKSKIDEKKANLQNSEKSTSFYRRKNTDVFTKNRIMTSNNDFVFCISRNENVREPPKKKVKLANFDENDDAEEELLRNYYLKQ